MQFLNLLLLTSSYVLFVISFIPHCQVHCDEVYEKDKMSCFFVYWNVDPTIIARDTDDKAVLFHEGVLRVHCNEEVTDDDLCFDLKLYGKNKICYFAYAEDADPECMAGLSENQAVKFHEGVLHNYEKTSVRNSKTTPRLGEAYTVAEKSDSIVEGMTYLFPKDYFKSTYLPYVSIHANIEYMKLTHFTIEVTIDGEKQNINCNAVVAIPYAFDSK